MKRLMEIVIPAFLQVETAVVGGFVIGATNQKLPFKSILITSIFITVFAFLSSVIVITVTLWVLDRKYKKTLNESIPRDSS